MTMKTEIIKLQIQYNRKAEKKNGGCRHVSCLAVESKSKCGSNEEAKHKHKNKKKKPSHINMNKILV